MEKLFYREDFTLRNDYAFKKIFGRNNSDCDKIRARFLSLILKIKEDNFKDLTLKNPMIDGKYIENRTGVLDIKLTLKNGEKISIEMQNIWHDYYEERSIYYLSTRYIEEFNKGEEYDKLNKCIGIHILNDRVKAADNIHSIFKMLNVKTYVQYTDLLEMHFLDLTRLDENKKDLSELERWLLFIRTNNQGLRNELSKEDKIMSTANIMMKEFISDEKERLMYEASFREECERASLLASGKRAGIKEGQLEGRREGRREGVREASLEIAKKLKNNDSPISFIVEVTGLSKEEVERL